MNKKKAFFLSLTLLLAACATAPPDEKVDNYWNGYTTVALSPSGRLAAAANRHIVVLFDLEEERQIGWFWAIDAKGKGFRLPRSGLGDTLEFIDEEHIVTTGMGGMATVWDIRNGTKTLHIDPPVQNMHPISMAWSPETGQLVLGMRDGTIVLTDPRADEAPQPELLLSHVGRVNDMVFSQDGRYMASAGDDRNVVIWDMETRKEIGRLQADGDISDLEVIAGQQSLVVAGDDVALWKFLSGEEALALKEDKNVGQWLGTASLYALQAGLLLTGIGGGISTHDPMNCGRFVGVSPGGEWLVDVKPGPMANKITVLDVARNEILHEVDVPNAICDVEFTKKGDYAVLVGDGGFFLVDTVTWSVVPMHLIVDGFSHAPRVTLGEPDRMGLDMTGYQIRDEE